MSIEHDLIAWLRRQVAPLPAPDRGIGDDAAVLTPPAGTQLVISTDTLGDEVHFNRDRIHPGMLGRKALLVNLSDLDAMGARPWFCLLSLSLPPKLARSGYARTLLEGFLGESRRWKAPLVGGNLAAGSAVQINVTIGGTIRSGGAVTRDGCRDGDSLYVVGHPGRSARGLEILRDLEFEAAPSGEIEARRMVEDGSDALCLLRHWIPAPPLGAGAWLQERNLASSLIDVSDGLVADLQRIAEASHVEIVIQQETLELLRREAGARITLDHVLNGGEDYALIFSCDDQQLGIVEEDFPAEFGKPRKLGKAKSSATPSVHLDDGGHQTLLQPQGFDHFP